MQEILSYCRETQANTGVVSPGFLHPYPVPYLPVYHQSLVFHGSFLGRTPRSFSRVEGFYSNFCTEETVL